MNVPAKANWKEPAEGLVEFYPHKSRVTKGLIGDSMFDWKVGMNDTRQVPAMLNRHFPV